MYDDDGDYDGDACDVCDDVGDDDGDDDVLLLSLSPYRKRVVLLVLIIYH